MSISWFDTVSEIGERPWKTVSAWQAGVASLGLAWLLYLLKTDGDGFIFLDYVNLAFHEAGHPIFGVAGETWGLYGGTIGQLVFPVVTAATFWMQREPVSVAVAGVWFFENFLNIARYMADARAQVLPLVGGGEHDWTNIFSRWGVLSSDVTIAHAVVTVGWLGMLSAWIWLGRRWLKSAES
ncbi:MAG: hypothetical protein ACREJU_12495 [Nitrospiraceae bacterium]